MSAFTNYLEKLDQKLHEKNKITEYFEKAEKLTGVRRVYLAGGLLLLWALYMILGRGAELICNLIGLVYPAYLSVNAIETSSKNDDTKWLIYWVTFSTFTTLEFFSDFIVSFVPFYWLMKCVFLFWCSAPIANNGSVIIYNRVLRPFVLKNKKTIDDSLDKAAGLAKEAAGKLVSGKSE